jgi:hypothetical protein
MFGSRRNRNSLIGTAARTAVVVKTANAVSGNRRGAAEPAAAAATAAPAAVAPAAGGLTDDAIARLQQLGEMHKSGILTDEEFATQKARILA